MPRYESLKAEGLSQRTIAQKMGMPEATLRNNLKVLEQPKAEGTPVGDQGPPDQENPKVHPCTPEDYLEGTPEGDLGTPPLYVHQGIPDDGEESSVGGEDIEEVHQGIPTLPLTGIHEVNQGPLSAWLSPDLVEDLTTAWPDLQRMLEWWQRRQEYAQEPAEKLERATYHVAPRWIEAIRREADLTGESYAAVVNRAFRQYFEGKST